MTAESKNIDVLPRVTVNKDNIIQEVKLWHVIAGKYVHIVQTDLDTDEPKYFTNGRYQK